MNQYDYFKPRTPEELWEVVEANPGAVVIAGGTDLIVTLKRGGIRPPALISLRSLPGLSEIETGGEIRIGAMTTIAGLLEHPELGALLPVLRQAAERIGSPQIRNVATVGGNLCNCSPCADTAPALLVSEARAVLNGPGGEREVPLAEFFLGPAESCLGTGEIMTGIILDKPAPGTRAVFLKKGRVKMDLAIASVAVLLEMDGGTCKKARVAAGSVAPAPLRLKEVENLLENQIISDELIAEAQQTAMSSVSPISDVRSSETYRREIIGVYVKRALEQLLEGHPPT